MKKSFTYKTSGVDIKSANEVKTQMASVLKTNNRRLLNTLGAFASLYDIKFDSIKHPVLVLKTEEPGSKQLLAFQNNSIESICHDMINHLINDCIVMGATPLAVQDAIICGKLEKQKVKRIVAAIARACKEQDCLLTGGETSEQPGVLAAGEYILTSSIVGIVEKSKIIDGSKIEAGDVVLCLEASGLHTNGYSLIRKILKEHPSIANDVIDGKNLIEMLLEPHRCYYMALKDLFDQGIIKGMAHITGGGIKENLNRILPENVNAEIDLSTYAVLPIYRYLKTKIGLEDDEMLGTFNMGVGIALVTHEDNQQVIAKHLDRFRINTYAIGKIVKGNKRVVLKNRIRW
ncbi:MAG: phosphoribosylformylglycinamidine cyclo-ligase [Spirochaetales bacterium]|nr:phosphoribosylformylglycinamidine cyclo-ligase [Spirochaetales bacterium]